MSNEPASAWPRWVMRTTVLFVAVPSALFLAFTWFNWTFAPMGGPAAYYTGYENEATNTLVREASQHAVSLVEFIVPIAIALILAVAAALMIWPKRFGFLMVAAVSPLAMFAIWIATKADLATIADPSSAMF